MTGPPWYWMPLNGVGPGAAWPAGVAAERLTNGTIPTTLNFVFGLTPVTPVCAQQVMLRAAHRREYFTNRTTTLSSVFLMFLTISPGIALVLQSAKGGQNGSREGKNFGETPGMTG